MPRILNLILLVVEALGLIPTGTEKLDHSSNPGLKPTGSSQDSSPTAGTSIFAPGLKQPGPDGKLGAKPRVQGSGVCSEDWICFLSFMTLVKATATVELHFLYLGAV